MTIEEKIRALPLALQDEVEDFVTFLLERRNPRSHRPLSCSWAGALYDLKQQYSSVEMQHAINQWRTENP